MRFGVEMFRRRFLSLTKSALVTGC
jgi:hypothetical protein